ncbi:hypothetical protein Sste5346_007897 [Sporothrix stenoceras]|uniref:Beta-glucuronidase C-terminal domain-containing protein n=1 Tax=Sporothrix stenoceras TaxID=5173 RepID=A0ABR3YT05_9PEZI
MSRGLQRRSNATRFLQIAANLTAVASLPGGALFGGPDLASDIQPTDWQLPGLFQNTTFNNGGNIKYATDHWYRCNGDQCVPAHFILHSNTIANTASHIQPMASFFKSFDGGKVKCYLDEINIQNVGTSNQTFSFSFATALYVVDFMLYAVTLGVDSVNWEPAYNSNQNVWQPSASSTMSAQTKNIYCALITVDLSVGMTRPSSTVELGGLPSSLTSVTVKFLTNPVGAVQNADKTTFGGSQWTFGNLGKQKTGVQSTTIAVAVTAGVAQIPIPDSAIAIVYL